MTHRLKSHASWTRCVIAALDAPYEVCPAFAARCLSSRKFVGFCAVCQTACRFMRPCGANSADRMFRLWSRAMVASTFARAAAASYPHTQPRVTRSLRMSVAAATRLSSAQPIACSRSCRWPIGSSNRKSATLSGSLPVRVRPFAPSPTPIARCHYFHWRWFGTTWLACTAVHSTTGRRSTVPPSVMSTPRRMVKRVVALRWRLRWARSASVAGWCSWAGRASILVPN